MTDYYDKNDNIGNNLSLPQLLTSLYTIQNQNSFLKELTKNYVFM